MAQFTIVGAGISGIGISSAISSSDSDAEILIYEKSKNAGGVLRDYDISSQHYFNSCQLLDADRFWQKCFASGLFYSFKHKSGSYTDIFGDISVCTNFSGPVYDGSIEPEYMVDPASIGSLVSDSIKVYPEHISKSLGNPKK